MDNKAALILTDSVVEATRLAMMVSIFIIRFIFYFYFRNFVNKSLTRTAKMVMMQVIIQKMLETAKHLAKRGNTHKCMVKDSVVNNPSPRKSREDDFHFEL